MHRPSNCVCGGDKDRRAMFCRSCRALNKKNRAIKPTSISKSGYVVRSDGVYEHRFVMELAIGRKLLRNEHVHHKNGIKSDNRIENLELLSASDHHREHMTSEVAKKRSILGHMKRWGHAHL